ncbi:hypothetical protein B0J11DRAFT_324922 [Dendryphion nanum]|uniref:Uncharacterized protein n=1 Tax=Dendryphion nanum TaxID=256645 RepID=A0A9P9IKP7_9PLEO|nr:hypothetical protein B0J11DRAFT_324922 [Dendryphion nanum]
MACDARLFFFPSFFLPPFYWFLFFSFHPPCFSLIKLSHINSLLPSCLPPLNASHTHLDTHFTLTITDTHTLTHTHTHTHSLSPSLFLSRIHSVATYQTKQTNQSETVRWAVSLHPLASQPSLSLTNFASPVPNAKSEVPCWFEVDFLLTTSLCITSRTQYFQAGAAVS